MADISALGRTKQWTLKKNLPFSSDIYPGKDVWHQGLEVRKDDPGNKRE